MQLQTKLRQGHYGNSDHKTSPSCFYADGDWSPYHFADFDRICQDLDLLALNGTVQIMFFRADSAMLVIAYRFTSDKAYDDFHHSIRWGSLGRGSWNPWHPSYNDCERFMIRQPSVLCS